MGKLIWIASYPKSGNTWVRIFLNTILINPDRPLSINEIARLTVQDSQAAFYEKLAGKKLSQFAPEELSRYRAGAQREMTRLHPNPVLVKTHSVLGDHDGVPLITPEETAAAVYLLRNPLDIVASYANHKSLSLDGAIERICKEDWAIGDMKGPSPSVPSHVSSWSTNVKSWTIRPHSQLLVLRYEDLLETPLKSFGQLTTFFNLKRSQEEIERAIRFTSIEEFKRQEAEQGFHERAEAGGRFFRRGRAGGWREELSPAQVAAIVARHGEQMARFGYLPEGY